MNAKRILVLPECLLLPQRLGVFGDYLAHPGVTMDDALVGKHQPEHSFALKSLALYSFDRTQGHECDRHIEEVCATYPALSRFHRSRFPNGGTEPRSASRSNGFLPKR